MTTFIGLPASGIRPGLNGELAIQQAGLAVDDEVGPPHTVLVYSGEIQARQAEQSDDVDQVQRVTFRIIWYRSVNIIWRTL